MVPKQLVIDTTCKSCRQFALNKVMYSSHAAVGLGHCALELRGRQVFKPAGSTCGKYDATDVRKAYLKFRQEAASA